MKLNITLIKLIIFLIFFNSQAIKRDWPEKSHNIAPRLKQNTGILVVAYNRPEYLAKLIKSLERNPESQILPFFFFLDGGPKSTQKANISLINNSKIKHKFIVQRKVNYGCDPNITDAISFMFDWCNFKRIVHFEDDVVISPDYLKFILTLHTWAKSNFDNVGAVQGWSLCRLNYSEKLKYLPHVSESFDLWLGYCMDKSVWNNIRSLVYEFEDIFFARPEPYIMGKKDWMVSKLDINMAVNHKRLFTPGYNPIDYRHIFTQPIIPTGQDGLLALAFYKKGYIKIATLVNRCMNIGRKGTHFSGQTYDNIMQNVTFHNFDQDKDIRNFVIKK